MSDTLCRILFVCTGNTCRSPLAQALCKKLLAERLNCQVSELPERGYLVQSAGLAAFPGCEASSEAVNIAREFGADLVGHQSQSLTIEMMNEANDIFAMTRAHLDILLAIRGESGPMPRLLADSGEDIADPLGCETDVYRTCARQILSHLQKLVPELLRR